MRKVKRGCSSAQLIIQGVGFPLGRSRVGNKQKWGGREGVHRLL